MSSRAQTPDSREVGGNPEKIVYYALALSVVGLAVGRAALSFSLARKIWKMPHSNITYQISRHQKITVESRNGRPKIVYVPHKGSSCVLVAVHGEFDLEATCDFIRGEFLDRLASLRKLVKSHGEYVGAQLLDASPEEVKQVCETDLDDHIRFDLNRNFLDNFIALVDAGSDTKSCTSYTFEPHVSYSQPTTVPSGDVEQHESLKETKEPQKESDIYGLDRYREHRVRILSDPNGIFPDSAELEAMRAAKVSARLEAVRSEFTPTDQLRAMHGDRYPSVAHLIEEQRALLLVLAASTRPDPYTNNTLVKVTEKINSILG
jgi:hypothetical protein